MCSTCLGASTRRQLRADKEVSCQSMAAFQISTTPAVQKKRVKARRTQRRSVTGAESVAEAVGCGDGDQPRWKKADEKGPFSG